jgi:hypothetical protein
MDILGGLSVNIILIVTIQPPTREGLEESDG